MMNLNVRQSRCNAITLKLLALSPSMRNFEAAGTTARPPIYDHNGVDADFGIGAYRRQLGRPCESCGKFYLIGRVPGKAWEAAEHAVESTTVARRQIARDRKSYYTEPAISRANIPYEVSAGGAAPDVHLRDARPLGEYLEIRRPTQRPKIAQGHMLYMTIDVYHIHRLFMPIDAVCIHAVKRIVDHSTIKVRRHGIHCCRPTILPNAIGK